MGAFNKQELIEIIKAVRQVDAAQILESSDLTPFGVQKFTLTLTTAKSEQDPFIIGFPFKSIWFKNATSNTVNVDLKLNKNDSSIAKINMEDNDSLSSSKMYSKGFLSWSAQSGQSIDVYVFVDAEIKSGSLVNSGTVNLQPSQSLSVPAIVTADATGTIKIPANASAKGILIENASAADNVRYGGNGTTFNGASTDGILLEFGSRINLDCIGDIYLVCEAGKTAVIRYVYLNS